MNEIYFVTGNKGKAATLTSLLEPTKYRAIQIDLEVPEIQAATALEVAQFKANFAFNKLRKPLVVQDSAFHINALSGFPGPYIKYVNETLGVDGLLRLMEGIKDRSAFFEQALVFIDATGNVHQFVSTDESGSIAEKAFGKNADYSWSDLWRVYMHGTSNKTLAQTYVEGNLPASKGNKNSETAQFVRWLDTRS